MTGSDGYRDEDGDNGGDRSGHDNDDALELHDAEQLALDEDEDERLPWLESGDDYEYDDGPDFGRILGLALLGLVALAAIVGGIWWSTHRTPDSTLVADGSTIKAPAEPYKEAPKQAGGKTFEGTGQTAFGVSEGRSPSPRLGEAGAAPKPSVDLAPKPPVPPSAMTSPAATARPAVAASAPAPAPAPAAAAGAPGTMVQVGAYSTRAAADAAWSRLTGQYSALSGQRHRIVEGQADIGTVFRLQALPGSAEAAHSLCGRLKSSGLACQVK